MFKVILTLYWLACFILTHLPPWMFPVDEPRVSDKLIHLTMYMFLGCLWLIAYQPEKPRELKGYGKGLLILTLYAGFDELSQILVDRQADMLDFGANVLGILLGTTLGRMGLLTLDARGKSPT